MSYCRWSSDGSDVYVYEDVNGGWTTHIAGRRRLNLDTLPEDPLTYEAISKMGQDWADNYKKYHAILDTLPFEDIVLPHAGESFNDLTALDCAVRLEQLRDLGYYVPQYAIEALRDEPEED